jgi:RNA polymerase sigma factor (TIGR02999 family)
MEITDLLHRAHDGDSAALDIIIPLVYDELKRLAASNLRRERTDLTIQATALVHEAFLRLIGNRFPDCENRSHFYGLAARVMRQVLIDMARARRAGKRGYGSVVPLIEGWEVSDEAGDAFLRLNDALDRLTSESSIKGRLIELRFFAGLTAEESATELSMSVHTVRRELRLAQAWLHRELS